MQHTPTSGQVTRCFVERKGPGLHGGAAGKGGTVTLRGNLKADDPTLDIDVSESARGPGGPGAKEESVAQVGTAEVALFTATVEDTGLQDTQLRMVPREKSGRGERRLKYCQLLGISLRSSDEPLRPLSVEAQREKGACIDYGSHRPRSCLSRHLSGRAGESSGNPLRKSEQRTLEKKSSSLKFFSQRQEDHTCRITCIERAPSARCSLHLRTAQTFSCR
jgi:hypothetical protein